MRVNSRSKGMKPEALDNADKVLIHVFGNGAVLEFCGPLPDGNGIDDLTAGLSADSRVLRAAYAALGAKVPHQLFLQHSSRLAWIIHDLSGEKRKDALKG